jgi:hypothetical protein
MAGKKKQKRKLVDSLSLIEEREACSLWSGSQGVYVFDKVEKAGDRSPVAKIYKNRQYYTGLFETKRPNIFSGDIKENDRRKYLIFKVNRAGRVEIYEKAY